MCKPFTNSKPLRGLPSELISAQSSLNMVPEPIEVKEDRGDCGPVFLSECDAWAKHSMEHMHQAFQYANDVQTKLAKIYWELCRVYSETRDKRIESLIDELREISDF